MPYRVLHDRFWNDPDYTGIGASARYLALYFLSSPQAHLSGIYVCRPELAAIETELDLSAVRSGIDTLSRAGFLRYDESTRVVWVRKMFRYQGHGDKNLRAAANQVPNLHKSFLVREFLEEYPAVMEHLDGYPIDTLSAKEIEKDKEKEREQTLPPTPDPPTQEEGSAPKGSAPPDCPHQEIIELYHETLPELPKIRVWNDQRRSHLRSRWREERERQELEWWREFFESVAESNFLMGRTDNGDRPPFVCSLDWLIKPTNFAKVLEGRYGPRRGKPPEKPDPLLDPHSWERHGIRKSSNSQQRWCSREGGWIDESDWLPRGEGE